MAGYLCLFTWDDVLVAGDLLLFTWDDRSFDVLGFFVVLRDFRSFSAEPSALRLLRFPALRTYRHKPEIKTEKKR